jgi:hypothetical protein
VTERQCERALEPLSSGLPKGEFLALATDAAVQIGSLLTAGAGQRAAQRPYIPVRDGNQPLQANNSSNALGRSVSPSRGGESHLILD